MVGMCHSLIRLSTPIASTSSRVNPGKLWTLGDYADVCLRWLNICSKGVLPPGGGVDNQGCCAGMGAEYMEEISVYSIHLMSYFIKLL